jgi:uracil-DNA glycosylase family 4
MSDALRDDLSELARLFATHAAWQRELGALELPHEGALPVGRPLVEAASAPAPSTPPPPVAAPAPPTPTVPPAAPVAASARPTPAPVVKPAAAPPVVRALFGEPAVAVAPPRISSGPPLEGEARVSALTVIQDEVRGCTSCRLGATRRNTVFARGTPFARLVFIGEGPGEQEDKQGLPFVGPAGQLLDKIISAMGLSPDDVYVANIVKCRPPNNRVPEPDEMRTCTPFLVRQLDLVRPEVIVALGRTAVGFLLDSKESMSRLRGKWHTYEGIPVLPTWHPAYLLRTPEAKADTWADMKVVMARLGLPIPSRGGNPSG